MRFSLRIAKEIPGEKWLCWFWEGKSKRKAGKLILLNPIYIGYGDYGRVFCMSIVLPKFLRPRYKSHANKKIKGITPEQMSSGDNEESICDA